jgi:sigma-E factor negative regulatory protein RseA
MNQADMNQDVRENLSTGIDGELSKEQLRFLLRRIDHDAALLQVWTRYHVARDGLRRQLPSMATAGFVDRVMLAIEQESLPAAAALMITQPTGDAERNATAALTSQPQTTAVAQAMPASRPATPAVVPPWLSSNNSAGLLSQQASATLGNSFDANQPIYTRRLSGYPSLPRYRTLDNNDGSYLLLLDPEQRVTPVSASRQAAATAQ